MPGTPAPAPDSAAAETAQYSRHSRALLVTRDQLSYGLSGALLTLNGVGMMLAARVVGRLVARLGEQRLLRLGGALLAIGYVLAALQPNLVWFPLAMLLSGIGSRWLTARSKPARLPPC